MRRYGHGRGGARGNGWEYTRGIGRRYTHGYVRRYARGLSAVAAGLLALAGCGSSGGGSDRPTDSATTATATAAPARDRGPVCVGTAPADGVHVLRGGGYRLPGGGGVQYEAASADGTTRTATLRDGASYRDGQGSRTVVPGGRIDVSGHAYTVSQICSYRVVLAPADAAARAALGAAPASMRPSGGAADAGLCFTTNAAVRAAAAGGFPPAGATWSLAGNGGRRTLPTGWSVALYSVDGAAGTAVIGANCAAIPVASYKDAAVGDTIEFAGVTFKVATLSEDAVVLTRTGT